MNAPACLAPLADQPRWVGWRWEERPDRSGAMKRTKPPRRVTGGRHAGYARNDDPATWAPLTDALAAVRSGGLDGVGLQLLDLRGFAAVDLDNVRDPETGAVLPWAADLIRRAASYAEWTPSGRGARILGRVADDFAPTHTKRAHPGGGEWEIYANTATGRYVTVTGDRLDGAPDALAPLDVLLAELLTPADGFTFDTGDGFEALPQRLRDCIAHGLTDDRSGDFQAAVNGLRARMGFDAALRILAAHPGGPAGKYAGRLETELRRSWAKAEAGQGYRPDHDAAAAETRASEPPQRASRFFCASTLAGRPIEARPWHVADLIPGRTVTLLGGDGGTGKSLLALQLAIATATGRPWIGRETAQGGALFLSAEDDADELHRRLADVLAAEGLGFQDLDRLTLRSLAGEDALLAVPDKATGALRTTALHDELDARLREEAPALLILDTAADLHAGNENDRAQVRQFVGILRGLAIRHACAVVLLAHPSLTGMASGSGLSGSTAWNGSVRSRLYLERITEEAYEPNPDARRLTTKKANYARTGTEIGLTWRAGVFVADAPEEPAGRLDRMAASAKAERVFLKLLRQFTDQGRHVSPTPSVSYAPTVFARHPEAEGMTKRALAGAMEKLLTDRRVIIAEHGRGASKRRHLIEAEGAAR